MYSALVKCLAQCSVEQKFLGELFYYNFSDIIACSDHAYILPPSKFTQKMSLIFMVCGQRLFLGAHFPYSRILEGVHFSGPVNP